MKLSHSFCNLLVCLLLALPLSATPLLTWKQQLVRQAVVKYQWLEAYNQQNDRQGLSHLNQYVIELSADWVEERPNKVILKDNYVQLATLLKTFNEPRQDKLRFYVVVVNDYQVDVKETVDPATLPDQITKLSEIAAPLQSKDHYQRFKAEIASIPAEIQAALQHKKYQEKAIYFYGHIKLYKLDAKPRYYYYDALSLLEGRLAENGDAIRNKSKEGISKATPAELKIEKVVANIINAIQVVVDKREESPQLKCDESTESMIAKTESAKEAGLASQIKALTYLMDHPSGQQQWKSSHLIVDDPAAINPDDLFSAEVLPDKLELLTQGNSRYQLYVVLKEVNFLLPKAEWEDFARQAASQSALAKKPNAIILVAPYYKTLCHGVNWLGMTVNKGTGLVMPAVYSSDATLSRLMNGALAVAGNSFESRFNQAYSHIAKKHTAYYYKVLWNNDLVYHGKEEKESVTGYEHITELVLLTDQRFDAVKAAHNAYQVTVQTNAYPGNAQEVEIILDAYEKYQVAVAAILADPPRFRQVDKLNLVESNINRGTSQEFVEWYVKRRRWGFLVYFSSPEDKLFYGGRNPEKVQDALLLIDCASALASLVGADFLFDSLGAYYAFSNELYGEAALYTVAASLPGFSSGMRRALTDGGAYALKTVQGTYVYRMKGVLATAPVPPFGIKDAFSQFTKSFLNTGSFRRASKYKTQTEFVKALEEGILANEDLARRLNRSPGLVDEYNQFYKQEKGTLVDFLSSPHLALLETHPKLYGQVKGLESELRKTFMADFGNNAAALTKFEQGSDKLVDAWKALAGFNNLRKALGNLEILEKASTKFSYNGKNSFEGLIELLKGHTNVRKLIDNLEKADELVGKVNDIQFSAIKTSPEIRLLSKSEQIGIIVDEKLKPEVWEWAENYRKTVTLVHQTSEGYKVVESGGKIAFDIGFKEGRVLSGDELNDYFKKGRGANEPYMPGSTVVEKTLKPGDVVYVVEYSNKSTPNPGGWGSKDRITTIKELREEIAVLQDWKDESRDLLVVRKYTLKDNLPVRNGLVGPQNEVTGPNAGKVYSGGGHQYEFIKSLRGNSWKDYFDDTNVLEYILK